MTRCTSQPWWTKLGIFLEIPLLIRSTIRGGQEKIRAQLPKSGTRSQLDQEQWHLDISQITKIFSRMRLREVDYNLATTPLEICTDTIKMEDHLWDRAWQITNMEQNLPGHIIKWQVKSQMETLSLLHIEESMMNILLLIKLSTHSWRLIHTMPNNNNNNINSKLSRIRCFLVELKG